MYTKTTIELGECIQLVHLSEQLEQLNAGKISKIDSHLINIVALL